MNGEVVEVQSSSFHPWRGNQSALFVIDVIASKPHFKLVIRQWGYLLHNTEGLICSSHTPGVCVSMLLPTLCANSSHIRLSQWPQSHMTAMQTAMHRHLHPPHLTSSRLGQLVHSMVSAERASEGASQWGMWTAWLRKQSCIYWKAHLGCSDSDLTLI